MRRTIVVLGRLAADEARVAAARAQNVGVQILSIERLAARLAGGFAESVSRDVLDQTLELVLQTPLGELDSIKALPGFRRAAARSLDKAWRAGIDFAARATALEADLQSDTEPHRRGSVLSRLRALALLESAVVSRLPACMHRPMALVARAMERVGHAPAVLGPVEIRGRTELAPCWRPLLLALTNVVPVAWVAGPRRVPEWLLERVQVKTEPPSTPQISAFSHANPRHEALEALRWARELMSRGVARPEEIGLAAARPDDYDDHLRALSADANLELHFVHGVRAASMFEGQAAAALADVLLRGVTQDRIRRLLKMQRSLASDLAVFPTDWARVLPKDAPLHGLRQWQQVLSSRRPEDWPNGVDRSTGLLELLELLSEGASVAAAAGERVLRGLSRSLFRTALTRGPAEALDLTLAELRLRDEVDPSVSMAWMPAYELAGAPRRFVRLLGLSSRTWPRLTSEDGLIPDHVVPLAALDPLPISEADRRDFDTICATTTEAVVLSWSRRDFQGRQLAKSPLVSSQPVTSLRRGRVPEHAVSESDRWFARPTEFALLPEAIESASCWRDWYRPVITAHDGLVRAGHPMLVRSLERPQSSRSLRAFLRDPLGFVWKYALGLAEPKTRRETLSLDPLAFGNLVHEILDVAVVQLEREGGLAAAASNRIAKAIEVATAKVATRWELELAVPPQVMWLRTQHEAQALCQAALSFELASLPGQVSWTEVPFGGEQGELEERNLPWDPRLPVEIPGAQLEIRGKIDRIDLSGDRTRARVLDYKTGRVTEEKASGVLEKGAELQRCLYAFAVQALLGPGVRVEAALVYPRPGGGIFPLEDTRAALDTLVRFFKLARTNLLNGLALPGTGALGEFNELRFALPASAWSSYLPTKVPLAREHLGEAAKVWEEP